MEAGVFRGGGDEEEEEEEDSDSDSLSEWLGLAGVLTIELERRRPRRGDVL